MKTYQDLEKKLKAIDKRLSVQHSVITGETYIYYLDENVASPVFSFKKYSYLPSLSDVPLETKLGLENLIKKEKKFIYQKMREENEGSKPDTQSLTATAPNNLFKQYTDYLADVLQQKNVAYGDSFTKSIDTYGMRVVGIRLSDKYNRIEHLITNDELKENDESLQDTLLDMAGYSILALKYLKEYENEE